MNLIPTPVPHEEAASLVSGKIPITRPIFDELLPEFQARAFTVTGVECLSTLQRVRDMAAELPRGGDWDVLKAEVLGEISPWLVTATDPEERAKQRGSAVRRAELILRNNGWAAYSVTNHRAIMEHSDVFPASQYLSSEDSRVRTSHAALNKKIFPNDHPFWDSHTPPWEHGCRCDKCAMLQDELDEIREAEQDLPIESRQILEGPMLQQIDEGYLVLPNGTGKLDIRTPRQKAGKGYEFNPNHAELTFDDVIGRYDPDIATRFQEWSNGIELPDGRSLTEALGGPIKKFPAKEEKPEPAPADPSIPEVRKSPVSAALDVKLRNKTAVRDAISAIDAVHDDGELIRIPVKGSPGPNALGNYVSYKGGKPVEINIRAGGSWPRLTTVHEIGHFLDHQVLGVPGWFASQNATTPAGGIVSLLKDTPTYARILAESGNAQYFASPHEMWARAYAQYIATVSGNPALQAELKIVQDNPWQPWRQWPDAEFAPILTAIRNLLEEKQWNPIQHP